MQEIDKKITDVSKQLAEKKEAKGLKELKSQKQKLEDDKQLLEEMIVAKEKELKKCELESESYFQEKRKLENEIYSGEINDVGQLEKMRKKADQCEKKEDEIANRFYDLTEELNKNKEELEKKVENIKTIIKQISDNEKQTEEQIKQQEGIISDLKYKKGKIVEDLDTKILEEYELLLEKYPGSAVVQVMHDMCAGCNIALPTSVLSELHVEGIKKCSNCGRILVDLDLY